MDWKEDDEMRSNGKMLGQWKWKWILTEVSRLRSGGLSQKMVRNMEGKSLQVEGVQKAPELLC